MNGEKQHKCPVCGRQFRTKRALADHRRDSHGTPGPAAKAARTRVPRRTSAPKTNSTASGRIVSGSDVVLVSTAVSAATTVGSVIGLFRLTPLNFTNTRLAQEAALWARWRPVKLSFTVQPSAGKMTSGAYVIAFTKEVSMQLAAGTQAVYQAAAMKPTALRSISEAATFAAPCDTTQKWYQTSGKDASDHVHGQVFIILAAPLGNITQTSEVSFLVRLDWSIAFDGPALGGASVNDHVYVDPGYEGYHTTSDSALGSKLLILKHVAGGSAVPFSRASPDTIYALDSQANLDYIKSNGEVGAVKFGVVLKTAPYKTFVLFEEKSEAKKYLDTGAISHCLQYYGAGHVVSPDNPAWTATGGDEAEVESLRAELEELRARLALLERPSSSTTSRSGEEYDFGS